MDRPFQETQVIVVELDAETPITNIPQNFAHEARNLTEINIPASVTIINGNGVNDGTPFYNNWSLTKVTFNSNTNLTEIKLNAFLNCTSLQVCHIPDSVLKIGNSAFNNTAITNNPFTSNSQCTSIGQYAFRNCSQMTAFTLPKGITELESSGYNFNGCAAMTTFDWNGNNSITTIPQRCFENCSSLTSMNMPKSVEVLSNNCFASCSSLIEISIPNSVKTIKNHAFAWCTSLEVIRMGNSFEYFNNTGDNSFTYSTGKVKEIYIPKSFYKTAPDTSLNYQVSYAFHGVTSDCKFFYCGTVEEFEAAKANFLTQKSATSNNGGFINATIITYAEYLANKDNYATGRYVVCGYNPCQAFYEGTHAAEAINGCQGVCTRCQETAILENPTHIDVWNFADENGNAMNVAAKIIATYKCEACGTINTTEEISAIFIPIGYTQPETGEPFLGYEVSINHKALERYEELSGETVQYGLLAGIAMDESGKPLSLDEEGKLVANSSTAVVNFTGKNYTNFEIKITGINKTTSLYCNAYAVIDKGVTYICDTASETATKKDVVIVTE